MARSASPAPCFCPCRMHSLRQIAQSLCPCPCLSSLATGGHGVMAAVGTLAEPFRLCRTRSPSPTPTANPPHKAGRSWQWPWHALCNTGTSSRTSPSGGLPGAPWLGAPYAWTLLSSLTDVPGEGYVPVFGHVAGACARRVRCTVQEY